MIVVGSGVAGLVTAVKTSARHQVTLITKDVLAESNTHYAQGGIAVVLPDNPDARQSAQESARESALKPASRSCKTCRHLYRPGLSDGHCGGRDDLPRAYTAGHPLRRLPDDGGASCAVWEPHQ